jgi:putative acetyltransferase
MNDAADITIRPISMDDAPALHAMRIMPGVQETISGIYSERLVLCEAFVQSLGADDHVFVAEALTEGDRRVVGYVALHVNPKPRKRHTAVLGVMVHKDWQEKGIGRRMIERALDLADNWLMLKRVELVVFASNKRAIELYRSFGFEAEGVLREASVLHGSYADEVVMGRLRENR